MALNGPCAKFKSRLCQYFTACTVNLAAFSIASIQIWPILAITPHSGTSNYDYTLKIAEFGWLMFAIPLVSAFGSIVAATIMNKIGRKNLILTTALPLTASCILLAAGNDNIYLFIATVTASVMNGVLHTAVPVYLAEIADPEIRGFLVGTFPVTQSYCTSLLSLLLPYASTNASILAYVSSTFTIIMAVLLVFLPESPYQFFLHGDHVSASKNLSKLRRRREVTEEIDRIRQGLEENGGKRSVMYLLKNKTCVKCLLVSLLIVLTQVLSGSTETFSYSNTIFLETSSRSDYARITILVLAHRLPYTIDIALSVFYENTMH